MYLQLILFATKVMFFLKKNKKNAICFEKKYFFYLAQLSANFIKY